MQNAAKKLTYLFPFIRNKKEYILIGKIFPSFTTFFLIGNELSKPMLSEESQKATQLTSKTEGGTPLKALVQKAHKEEKE